MLLLQIHLTRQEFIIYALIIGVVLGFLLGLIPLILGIRKKKTRLGVYGLIASIIGGAISSILSLVIVGVFIYLILKKPATKTDSAAFDSGQLDSKDSNSDVFDSGVSNSNSSNSKSSDSGNF